METWILKSSVQKQITLGLFGLVSGFVLLFLTKGVDLTKSSNSQAGFFLGIILLVLGIWALIGFKKETVTVDPVGKIIKREKLGWSGRNENEYKFAEIQKVLVGYIGKRSSGVNFYYLILKLKDGSEIAITTPGIYDQASDRDVVEGWKTRLEEYLKS